MTLGKHEAHKVAKCGDCTKSLFVEDGWDNPPDFETWSSQVEQARRDGYGVDRGQYIGGVTIIAAAGNRYMSKILDDTRLLVRVFTATFWQYDSAKLTEANQFHKRLLDAMQNRDSESARAATVEAMRVARDNALKAWDRQEGQDVMTR